MAGDMAEHGFSTIVAPPKSFIIFNPFAPSEFAPVNTTPIRVWQYTQAADSNKISIEGREKLCFSSVVNENVKSDSTRR